MRHVGKRDKVVFLVCHFVPYPPASGIQTRVFRLLEWLRQAGIKVVLVVVAEFTDVEALRRLQRITYATHWTKPAQRTDVKWRTRLGARFPALRRIVWETLKPRLKKLRAHATGGDEAVDIDELRAERVKKWFVSDRLLREVGKLAQKYDPRAVIAEYIFATPLFAAFPPQTLKIVDTIDIFSLKESQVGAFGITDFLATNEARERRYLLSADLIIAIQAREAALLQAIVPEREVILAGVDFDVVNGLRSRDVVPFRVTVVASDNPLNVHGFSAFLAECWPRIRSACPAASLQVVGRIGDLCKIDDSSILYSGWVADLDAVYREAAVVINPTIAGTGLKIKSVEAIAHGKPLVAWPHGVDGLEYDGAPPFIACQSWSEFGSTVIRLLTADVERQALSERALAYARKEFAASSVYAELGRRLETALAS